jgi:hypothetical protein
MTLIAWTTVACSAGADATESVAAASAARTDVARQDELDPRSVDDALHPALGQTRSLGTAPAAESPMIEMPVIDPAVGGPLPVDSLSVDSWSVDSVVADPVGVDSVLAEPVVPGSNVPGVSTAMTATRPAGPVVRSGAALGTLVPVGEPTRIRIPALGVDHPVVPTDVGSDGAVTVPVDPGTAGWVSSGPRPGERGPAILVGHVDSRTYGPGVFYGLRDLAVGDEVFVDTSLGATRFVARSVEQFAKDAFPTDLVYGSTYGSTLRLITCGGSFDDSVRSYRDNIVAFLVRDGTP